MNLWLKKISLVFAVVGGLVAFGTAAMVCVSIAMRSMLSRPIAGDVELTQFGIALCISLCLPWAQLHGANIIVDFFTSGASARNQRRMDAIGSLLYTLVLALVCWRVAVGGIDIHAAHESSMLMNLPLWIPYALMVPGLALCVVIGLRQTATLMHGTPGGHA